MLQLLKALRYLITVELIINILTSYVIQQKIKLGNILQKWRNVKGWQR